MKRLWKLLVFTLCIGLMAGSGSSMMAYASSVESSETSDASSAYFEIKDGKVIVKKEGYYGWCVKENFEAIPGRPYMSVGDNYMSNYTDTPQVGSVTKYSVGDELDLTVAEQCTTYIYFGETASSTDTVFETELSPEPVVPVDESLYYPELSVSNKSSDDNGSVFTVKAGVSATTKEAGGKLFKFEVLTSSGSVYYSQTFDGDSSKTFDVTISNNDSYMFRVTDTALYYREVGVDVNGVASIILGDDTTEEDSLNAEPPVLTCEYDDIARLNGEDGVITIKTNEPCSINIDGTTYSDTSEVKHTIFSNGTYEVVATNAAGVTSSKVVKVTKYSATASDESYSESDRDSLWGTDGSNSETGATSNDMSGMETLPQTGETSWIWIVAGSAGVAVLAGAGLFALRHGKKKSEF